MPLRLVDVDWGAELVEAVCADPSALRVVCPFVKAGALHRLLACAPERLQLITRFNLDDFAEGVSDLAALRAAMEHRGEVRGIRGLHAKLYLFGTSRAVVTSANLTAAALDRNQEFGAVVTDAMHVAACQAYFDRLWEAGMPLTLPMLEDWTATVRARRAVGGSTSASGGSLGDFGAFAPQLGAAVEAAPPAEATSSNAPALVVEATQAFVKFLGRSSTRELASRATLDEIESSGANRVLAYSRRPQIVEEDALMFIGRFVKNPNDVRVFGRAIALSHVSKTDTATEADIAARAWRAKWPYYIRVHHAEFIAGTLANGISLNALIEALGANAFRSTQERLRRGEQNINPRRALAQQPAIELSEEGLMWMRDKLQRAFDQFGAVPREDVDKIV